MEELLKDDAFCEALGEVFMQEIFTDEESFRKKGFYLIKAYIEGNVDNALIALCGWSMDSLIKKAQAAMKEEE